MSRPQKIIPPIKASFGDIVGAIALGKGKGKRVALKLAKSKATHPKPAQSATKKP